MLLPLPTREQARRGVMRRTNRLGQCCHGVAIGPGCLKCVDELARMLEPVIREMRRMKSCDRRCMGARGELCRCGCGGRNHGTQIQERLF